MSRCRIHGTEYNYDDGCPNCRQKEENDIEAAYATLSSLNDLGDKTLSSLNNLGEKLSKELKNPGDFECPHCKYVTLKYNATRCPICHGEPGIQYWRDVCERQREEERARVKREDARAKREEAQKIEDEARKTKAREDAAEELRIKRIDEERRKRNSAIIVVCVLGVLIFIFSRLVIAFNQKNAFHTPSSTGRPVNAPIIRETRFPERNDFDKQRVQSASELRSHKDPARKSLRERTKQFDDL